MPRGRLIASVLLPFAAGYFLSYVFRTVNAVIATDLAAELNLNAADLGLLTSTYFLVFAAVQLPLGVLLDRVGPTLVQSVLMLVTGVGALVFALADGFVGLMVGRALLGLGVSVALMAGVKAISVWFPSDRSSLATGWLVMLGALGALTATAPADLVVQAVGWRGLFVALAGLSGLTSLLVLFAAPEPATTKAAVLPMATFSTIYRSAHFWRVAPLSAFGVGTSWSLQGLWAAPWLRDVNGFERSMIVDHLSGMAIAVCVGALLFGAGADRLRTAGLKAENLLAATLTLSVLGQTALILNWPLPPLLPFAIIAAAGAATVLSFAVIRAHFPKAIAGRANGALNLLHVGAAFAVQSATGFLIAQWPDSQGSYPVEAHRTAMAIILAPQLASFVWFALAFRVRKLWMKPSAPLVSRAYNTRLLPSTRFGPVTGDRWRVAAIASICICVALATVLASTVGVSQADLFSAGVTWAAARADTHLRLLP